MKKYSIFVTHSSRSGSMRRFDLSANQVRLAIGFLVLVVLSIGVFSFDYTLAVSRHVELKQLRQENQKLENYVHSVSAKAEKLENHLQRIEDFTIRLRSITNRQGGVGPLPYSPVDSVWQESKDSVEPDSKKKILINSKENFQNYLDDLENRSHLAQKQIWQTIGYLEERKHLLVFTPTISPVVKGGRITSRFGYRDYPVASEGFYSSNPHFHNGLDIAASRGEPVVAPAHGVVVAVGYDSGTGNYIIINHGYQLRTLYGHLNSVYVKKYQKVQRGDRIGSVGNTGRSTGPHLHYEVRISSRSVDPEHYILNIF